MNIEEVYRYILAHLRANTGTAHAVLSAGGYTGSPHMVYGVPAPVCRVALKELVRAHKAASADEWLALTDVLMAGKSYEEKLMGGYLLGYVPSAQDELTPEQVSRWLDKLVGWAEIDALCQSNFSADFWLARWSVWRSFLRKLAQDENVNKRRAALVLLVKATSKSHDARLHGLAYQNIEALKFEKDILITKAISWLLRAMVDTQPESVRAYMVANADTLPKIVLRETYKKLLTGKKNS